MLLLPFQYTEPAQSDEELFNTQFDKPGRGCDRKKQPDDILHEELGYLNMSITDQDSLGFQLWADYDESRDNFCILDDHQPGAEYVDLHLNPERYTGYKGESAHRIWRSIYLENCFG